MPGHVAVVLGEGTGFWSGGIPLSNHLLISYRMLSLRPYNIPEFFSKCLFDVKVFKGAQKKVHGI